MSQHIAKDTLFNLRWIKCEYHGFQLTQDKDYCSMHLGIRSEYISDKSDGLGNRFDSC